MPKYQREIRAEIARVKEISESDSSSLSDLDVLEGIKTNKERINNKELVRKSPRMYFNIGLQWTLSGNQVV